MGRYRKRPLVIEAWQNGSEEPKPTWLEDAIASGAITGVVPEGTLSVATSEGTMRADVGDWIIQGAHGELYPCKPDIFEATYDKVDDEG